MNDNPLLDFSDLPRFATILPAHVLPALQQLLKEAQDLVARLTHDERPASWQNFAAPLADGLEPLSRAWGIVGHLHAVNDVPAWRDAYNALLPDMSRFYAELGQNLALFERYKAIQNSADFAHLSKEQQRVIENEVRDFKLSGAELPDAVKPRFQAISEELAQLSAKFSENLLDATNAFTLDINDATRLSGLPEDVKAQAKQLALDAGLDGWRFSLHAPSYMPLLQYADDRALREEVYRAYATRAAEFNEGSSKAEWDNTPVMLRLLQLRAEEAQMLGFANFGEVSLVSKMADSPAQVKAFLHELAAKARPFAECDYRELCAFAAQTLHLPDLAAWDISYASEKLRQQRYAFSEQEVKAYFTEPKVLEGLFGVIERLFKVRIRADDAPVWHEDVRFFRIENADQQLVGQFYLDLYARPTKRSGAWMDEARTRRRTQTGIQTPIAYLNCNFSRPLNGKPATFTHDDVITLFHETGHGLHHLLTRVEELAVSGIHGVEWDAVELPSQFMENYCWEWDVVRTMSAHVDSGEALPRALFDKMHAARNFQSGLMMLRQVEFSLFDMQLHTEFDPHGEANVMDLLRTIRRTVAVLSSPDWGRFPNSFAHIFGGGYAAGYYSYKWAEVLSADAYAAFEEAGDPFDADIGRRFLEHILAVGGSRPAIQSFLAFRGRAPNVDALLRHNAMG